VHWFIGDYLEIPTHTRASPGYSLTLLTHRSMSKFSISTFNKSYDGYREIHEQSRVRIHIFDYLFISKQRIEFYFVLSIENELSIFYI